MTNKEIYLAATALCACTSTAFWTAQRASGLTAEAYLNTLRPTSLEKRLSVLASEIHHQLSKWVEFLTGYGILKQGYCDEIAGDLGDVLFNLGLIEGWNPGCYETWVFSYQPKNCPWRIDHWTLPTADINGNCIIDIPMSEYCRFDTSSKKWTSLKEVTFKVHVIRTAEDFLAAYPGMTQEEAVSQANSLQESEFETTFKHCSSSR